MSDWDRYQMTERIRAILRPLQNGYPYESYDGNPYLSAYQIALEFQRQFPREFQEMARLLGGEGSGQGYSLPMYIARFLPNRADAPDIEVAFLHHQDLISVYFTDNLKASTAYLTLFRLRSEP